LKKFKDDICKIGKCVNVDVCLGLCPCLKYVNGKSKSKEPLLSDIIKNNDISADRDYNAELSELADDHQNKMESMFERMTELVEGMKNKIIPFYEKRKIAAVVLVTIGFTKKDVEDILKVSSWNLWRILK
jgi:hypothetical protein